MKCEKLNTVTHTDSFSVNLLPSPYEMQFSILLSFSNAAFP